MAEQFQEFFKLAPEADAFQKRIYAQIAGTNSMMNCYNAVYQYIIAGLFWRSRKDRHDEMDDRVDISKLDQQQFDDAAKFFEEGVLAAWDNRVWFEYLVADPQPVKSAGPNTFVLRMDPSKSPEPQFAYRQVQLYLQLGIYNEEYDVQAKYRIDNHIATPLPNSKIAVNASTARVDPDNPGNLSKFVTDLVKWMKENYPDLKVLGAAKTVDDFFNLIFAPDNDELTRQAVQSMLNTIRDMNDSKPAGMKKAFRTGAVFELNKNNDFWSNLVISNAYSSVVKLSQGANERFYTTLSSLFASFLSPNKYAHETANEAIERRNNARTYISAIFFDFPKSKDLKPAFKTRYQSMMNSAMQKVQKTFPLRYTSTLLNANNVIPSVNKVNTILPDNLANALKEKADEVLKTLPLLRNGTKVRFFTVQNYADLSALNGNAVSVPDQSASPVTVPGDPTEDGENFYRPVYRSGFRTWPKVERAIAFGNLPSTNGVFYYRHIVDPAVATVTSTYTDKRILTIDFQNYTSMYPGKKNGSTKNDDGEAYKSGGKTSVFFRDLRATTKWEDIKGGRRYDPYYSTVPPSATQSEAHLTAYVAAARGAARALPLGDETLCVWFWNVANQTDRDKYEKLGEVLGLPKKREIKAVNYALLKSTKPCAVEIDGKIYAFENLGLQKFRSNGFSYPIISLKYGSDQWFFARVNTPVASVASVLTAGSTKRYSRPFTDDPRSILEFFNFSYYRRITSIKDTSTNEEIVTEDSKVIQLYSKNDNRKPDGAETVVINWSDPNYDAIGANLPICFNVDENILHYFKDKQSRGKMINKGNPLFREAKPRSDAGTAMKAIFNKLKSPLATAFPQITRTKIPATPFANGAMKQSAAVQDDWSTLKVASGNYLPINQEWCHLRGHGDGGDEYPGNFVSGSYHCNTEQLAIETGQRVVTQQGVEKTYLLHTTSYMLRDAADYKSTSDDQRKSQVITANYLNDQVAYQKMRESHLAQREAERDASNTQPKKKQKTGNQAMQIDTPVLEQGDVAPLAAYIRYKVMKTKPSGTSSAGSGSKRAGSDFVEISKYFDFIFEGQSEFIDKYQFTILSQAVRFALAGKTEFDIWYQQAKDDLET
jgi:hypothetical protein